MKRFALLAPLLLLCAAWGATRIRWCVADEPIIEIRLAGNPTIQFGLRDDGVVVWREITNSTNSPAEDRRLDASGMTNWLYIPYTQ